MYKFIVNSMTGRIAKKWSFRCGLLGFVLILLTPSLSAAARTITEMEAMQQEIQAEARETREYLAVTQQEMEGLETEIYIMDAALDEATEQLEIINQALDDTIAELEETEIALEQARDELDEHFDRFKTRLRVMYIHGPVGYLEVVLQATSFNEFLTRLDHMNTVARSDREMAERLQAAEDLVEQKLEETFRQMTHIESLRVLQADRIMDLEFALDQKYNFMSLLEEDAYQHEIAIRRLEQADRDITEQIQRARAEEEARRRAAQEAARRAQQQVVQPRGGVMHWPLPGHYRVSSPYGNRTHPISRRPEFHTGVDIPAPSGTNIVAAESGTVIISGWNGGFGNTVVIDHGGGLTTLYAHNSRNIAVVGQWVNRGEVIARVGSTGVSTGPHLHFEVRHDGRHVNPNGYLGI